MKQFTWFLRQNFHFPDRSNESEVLALQHPETLCRRDYIIHSIASLGGWGRPSPRPFDSPAGWIVRRNRRWRTERPARGRRQTCRRPRSQRDNRRETGEGTESGWSRRSTGNQGPRRCRRWRTAPIRRVPRVAQTRCTWRLCRPTGWIAHLPLSEK